MAKDRVFREDDEDFHASDACRLAAHDGEYVVDSFRFSCTSAVGTFLPHATGLEGVVSVTALVAYD